MKAETKNLSGLFSNPISRNLITLLALGFLMALAIVTSGVFLVGQL